MPTLNILRNYQKPTGYRYYQYYWTEEFGDYVVWSRDGKRYYIDGATNAKLLLLPNTPFKNATSAKKYLERRITSKDIFGVKNKSTL